MIGFIKHFFKKVSVDKEPLLTEVPKMKTPPPPPKRTFRLMNDSEVDGYINSLSLSRLRSTIYYLDGQKDIKEGIVIGYKIRLNSDYLKDIDKPNVKISYQVSIETDFINYIDMIAYEYAFNSKEELIKQCVEELQSKL